MPKVFFWGDLKLKRKFANRNLCVFLSLKSFILMESVYFLGIVNGKVCRFSTDVCIQNFKKLVNEKKIHGKTTPEVYGYPWTKQPFLAPRNEYLSRLVSSEVQTCRQKPYQGMIYLFSMVTSCAYTSHILPYFPSCPTPVTTLHPNSDFLVRDF